MATKSTKGGTLRSLSSSKKATPSKKGFTSKPRTVAKSNPTPSSEAPRTPAPKAQTNTLGSSNNKLSRNTLSTPTKKVFTNTLGNTNAKVSTNTLGAPAKNAAIMNAARSALAARTPTESNAGGPTLGGVGNGPQINSPVAPVPVAPTPEVVARPNTPAAPVPVVNTGNNSGAGAGGGSFTSLGRRTGPVGMLLRQRQNRGPMNQLSMTPELLRRMAASHFSRGR